MIKVPHRDLFLKGIYAENYIAVLLRIGATSLKLKVNRLEVSCPVEYLREELDTSNPCFPS